MIQMDLTEKFQIFMEHSSNGDPRGDIIARGIVSEEQARMMYERYVAEKIWSVQAWRILTSF